MKIRDDEAQAWPNGSKAPTGLNELAQGKLSASLGDASRQDVHDP